MSEDPISQSKDKCSSCPPASAADVSPGAVPDHSVSTLFRVSGMDCGDEVQAVQRALATPEIFAVQANIMAATVKVLHSQSIEPSEIRRRIEAAGLKVAHSESTEKDSLDHRRITLVAVSGLMTGLGFLAQNFDQNKFLTLFLCATAVVTGGLLIFPKAWRAMRKLSLDMNVLMSVAVIGAFSIRQWAEAATVVFLFSLSELLEAFSVARARRAITEVMDLTPKMSSKIGQDGSVSAVRTEEVKKTDVLLVKPGERIPVDGIVHRGSSTVNQAPLTGESVAVEKQPGDKVLAGTINETGALEVTVTSSFGDSKISQVIRLIGEAQEKKAPSERFVDSFAKFYTPVVFALAIITALLPPLLFHQDWGEWFYKSLVLLVVACPCALVISTPVSIVSALTAMARRGVLVKGGAFLESLAQIRALAVDKTGTVTEGKPKVQRVILVGGSTEESLLKIAVAIEKLSSHPLANAVLAYAGSRAVPVAGATDFKSIVGRGAEATIEGHRFFLGNHRFTHELGVCTPELEGTLSALESEAFSVVVVGHMPHEACAGDVLGVIAIGDTVRTNAAAAFREIRALGVEVIEMLSGDNQKTASAIAAQAGITEAKGDLLPEDKVVEIKRLVAKYGVVGMIGDGINDAPALAQATVGIAMGAAGTDTAIETADVALMRDDLSQVATAIRQGKRALGVIKFNISFAIGIKIVFLVLTFLGKTNLWLAVGADTGASLLVIANALRLLKI